jgi:hypothetical protein
MASANLDPRVKAHVRAVVQTWFNSEQIRADLSEAEPL